MGDWLEGNKMRTQSTLQARKMAADNDQRKFQNMFTGIQTFQPLIQKELDVAEQEDLYGEGGVLRDFKMDTMAKEQEYTRELKEIDEANITDRERATYFKTTGKQAVENGALTNDFIKWKYGNDMYLQWERFRSQRRQEEGGLDVFVDTAVRNFRDQHSDILGEIDPETGRPVGYNPEKKQQLVDHLAKRIMNSGRSGEFKIYNMDQARARATQLIEDYDWAKGGPATSSFPKESGYLSTYTLKPEEFGTTGSGTGRDYVSPKTKLAIRDFNSLIQDLGTRGLEDEELLDVYEEAKRVKKLFSSKSHQTIYEDRILEDATKRINSILGIEDPNKLGKTVGTLKGDWTVTGTPSSGATKLDVPKVTGASIAYQENIPGAINKPTGKVYAITGISGGQPIKEDVEITGYTASGQPIYAKGTSLPGRILYLVSSKPSSNELKAYQTWLSKAAPAKRFGF